MRSSRMRAPRFIRRAKYPSSASALCTRPIGASSRDGATISSSDKTGRFTSLVEHYGRQVERGELLPDPAQRRAARKLTRLQRALGGYDHGAFLRRLERLEELEEQSRLQRADTQQNEDGNDGEGNESDSAEQSIPHPPLSAPIPVPRGFYIHGDVGVGKSMLLNNFYKHAPPSIPSERKRRIHFHSFLQDIHRRVHALNEAMLREHGRSFHVNTSRSRNPILRVARQLSDEITLLCVDEMQVTDVADAMILRTFFEEVWRRGVVVVATSNRPPDGLYEGGLNREYFAPFIDMLGEYCVVHRLGGDSDTDGVDATAMDVTKDYRRIRSGVDAPGSDKCGDYFHLTREGSEEDTSILLDELYQSFDNTHHVFADVPLILDVNFRRTISVSRYHSNVIARFTFDELCITELGSSDYHAIANHFHIIMIENIPQLTLKHPDRARRFITLVDELYEAGCCLVCSAVDVPDRLFVGKSCSGALAVGGVACPHTTDTSAENNMHAINAAQAHITAVSELASVKELSFAFGRAASRLLEMCSTRWWEEKADW